MMGSPNRQIRDREESRSGWLHGFAVLTAWCAFGLIFIGGLVTSTGSGLAVPDWPLAFGRVFPKLAGGALFEHGHRLAAAAVGLLTVILTVWICLSDSRKWVRVLALSGLGAVVFQGLLGGATVILELPTAVSVSHALLAQAFFCVMVTLAIVTNPGWRARSLEKSGEEAAGGEAGPQRLCIATATVIFIQLLLGALMRHTHAGPAIPDFPLAFGGLVPPLGDPRVVIHFLHRLGAAAVAGFVIWTATRVIRRRPEESKLLWPACSLLALLAFQIILGALTIWTRKAVIPTTAHVAVGAGILAVTLILTLRLRERRETGDARRAHRWVAENVPV